ncbi:MAG: SapB/AmfS family lanthipeptide [Pseudonocardiaceae bacterium]
MSLLDLQGMEDETPQTGAPAGGSSRSKHSCHGGSGLSVALCDGGSGLSALLCK